jgi:carotenoid 1,2-hydratase
MRTEKLHADGAPGLEHFAHGEQHGAHDAAAVSRALSGHGRGAVRAGESRPTERLAEPVQAARLGERAAGAVPGGGQRASGAGRADGRDEWPACGRARDGAPRFDQAVAPGGYLWWYIDALSDDGQHGLTIIAFIGSVFSPYYRLASRQTPADPKNHCCINVALYGKAGKRWTMTERSRASLARDATSLSIGPSSVRWEGASLVIDFNEIGMPIPLRARGRVRLHPKGLSNFITHLDASQHHHWGPIAPCAHVEVELAEPAVKWKGQAYFDSNEGSEPINTNVNQRFKEWDWSRASLKDGSTAVIYDVRQTQAADRVLGLRFKPNAEVESFESPERYPLPSTSWKINRNIRNEANTNVSIVDTLEDTPFYARSVLKSHLLGEEVVSMHETLNVARLTALSTQLMLPFRMPRVR